MSRAIEFLKSKAFHQIVLSFFKIDPESEKPGQPEKPKPIDLEVEQYEQDIRDNDPESGRCI